MNFLRDLLRDRGVASAGFIVLFVSSSFFLSFFIWFNFSISHCCIDSFRYFRRSRFQPGYFSLNFYCPCRLIQSQSNWKRLGWQLNNIRLWSTWMILNMTWSFSRTWRNISERHFNNFKHDPFIRKTRSISQTHRWDPPQFRYQFLPLQSNAFAARSEA